MTSITSSVTTLKKLDPPIAYLLPGRDNKYMMSFAVQSIDVVYTVDLFSGPKYFDLKMDMLRLDYGVASYIPLYFEQCTKEHWRDFP